LASASSQRLIWQELSDLSNNPSPEALQELAKKLQEMQSSSKDGQSAIAELAGKLVDLARGGQCEDQRRQPEQVHRQPHGRAEEPHQAV
jgi:predicted transcriptional regulator